MSEMSSNVRAIGEQGTISRPRVEGEHRYFLAGFLRLLNVRIYYRPKGRPKVRLRGEPWTPGFMAAYEAAKGIEFKTSDRSRAALPGTWRWLCVRYFSECADYKRLDARTQRVRRQILEGTFNEPIAPNSERFFQDFPLAKMNANAVEVLRDRKLSTPEAANGRVKAMRQVFKWGVAKGHAPFNPAREVSYFKSGSEGFHTWTGGSTAI